MTEGDTYARLELILRKLKQLANSSSGQLNIDRNDSKTVLYIIRDLLHETHLLQEIRRPIAICKEFRTVCANRDLGYELQVVSQGWSKLRKKWKAMYATEIVSLAYTDIITHQKAMEEANLAATKRQEEAWNALMIEQQKKDQLLACESRCAKLVTNGLNNHHRYDAVRKGSR